MVKLCLIEIVPTERKYLWELAENLRGGDQEEVSSYGFSNRQTLWRSYKNSAYSHTALIDGRVAAIWGCSGMIMGNTGAPWLLTSPEALKVSPLRFARVYKAEVQKMLKMFPNLVNYVDSSYNQAVRLLQIVGFDLEDPKPYGKNGGLFRKFTMCEGK